MATRDPKMTPVVHILFLSTMQAQIFGGRSAMGQRRGGPSFFFSSEIRRETDQTAAAWKEGRWLEGLKNLTDLPTSLPEELSE